VARADVLVENFRTGVLDRLGIPISRMHEINPALVVLSITGFGHDGPEAGRAGYDQIAQGEAGLMSLTGPGPGEPTRVGVPIGDLLAGMYGAFGVVSALVEREQSGKGTTVRTSLLSALVGVHAFQGTRYTVAGEVPHPIGNHHPSIAPYGAFQAADSVIQVAVGNQAQWQAFCTVTGIAADDADFATNGARVANRQQLIETVEKRLVNEPAAVWLQRLREAGVPSGAVRTLEEVYEWEQTQSQALVVQVEHPTAGSIRLPGPAVRMEDTQGASVLRGDHLAPPTLGQHDREIREWLDS
jgi:formyl-CoA transferase